jgi:hypothetical protein
MPLTNRKVEVVLDDDAREQLQALIRNGSAPARKVRNARVLLLADEDRREGRRPDWYIAECLGLSERQICRIRQQFAREGLSPTLERKRRSDADVPKKFDGHAEAQLVTLCCSTPPEGHERWTLRLLVDELARLQVVTSVCAETVRKSLKKIDSSPGRRSGSAFRSRTGRGSSRKWSKSSMSTATPTTKRTR